jgi:hypothetical protein
MSAVILQAGQAISFVLAFVVAPFRISRASRTCAPLSFVSLSSLGPPGSNTVLVVAWGQVVT